VAPSRSVLLLPLQKPETSVPRYTPAVALVGLSGAAEDAAEGRLEIWGGGEGAPRLEAFKHILAH
jgi:hypothetical protein